MDLVEFLRARLDEDEQIAHAAAAGKPEWRWDREHMRVDLGAGGWPIAASRGEDSPLCDVDAKHIARHDPARVLADVEAKRRIIDEHAIVYRDIGWLEDDEGERVEEYAELPVCGLCVPKHSHFSSRESVPIGPCRTLRLLALPYADHADFQPEWKP